MDALSNLDLTIPGEQFTTGSWASEGASASAFDQRLTALGLFRAYREVAGTLIHPRAGQRERAMRIDRVLIPTQELIAKGWGNGAIGVEIKRSGVPIGPPLAQAVDYVHGAWRVGGIWIQLDAVFLWPAAKQSGAVASVMIHNRVGSVSHDHAGSGSDTLKFALGEQVLIASNPYSGIRLGFADKSGHAVGSR